MYVRGVNTGTKPSFQRVEKHNKLPSQVKKEVSCLSVKYKRMLPASRSADQSEIFASDTSLLTEVQ